MMDDIRYYPLVDMDTKGVEVQAMTPTDSEITVRKHHRLWLTEIVRNYFRLGAKDKPSVETVNALRVHCPKCGGVLRPITAVTQKCPYPLYACDECRGEHGSPGAV